MSKRWQLVPSPDHRVFQRREAGPCHHPPPVSRGQAEAGGQGWPVAGASVAELSLSRTAPSLNPLSAAHILISLCPPRRASWRTSRGTSCSSSRPRMGLRPASPWRSTRRWVLGGRGESGQRGPEAAQLPGDASVSWPPLPRPARTAAGPSCSRWPEARCQRESTLVSGLGPPRPCVAISVP